MRSDAEVFVGTWEAVVPGKEGEMWGTSTWTIDHTLNVQIAYPEEGGRFTSWELTLDPDKCPKEFKLSGFNGIYEIDGDRIRVASSSGDRPTNFESKDGVTVYVLRRIEPKK
ncbi:hypothetical protein J8F10_13035 [Gemmata sp. G18]|uniref:Lipocalin-like domain-containing protein n=1 Tax=Gemmata palustris TaxID=2822762 RepID=A0ABS5BR56_9BACT|nr:hypothetical protein [Gemmata palustris]MBP3956208.1 hypothetical protein [Gemmata palustris]